MKSSLNSTFLFLSFIICCQLANASNANQAEGDSSGLQHKEKGGSFKWDNSAPHYHGCFKDTEERMFKTGHKLTETLSIKTCFDLCLANGFLYAGLQYSVQCFCGNNFPNSTIHPKINERECQMKCSGNDDERCGGPWAMSLYKIGNLFQVIDRAGNRVNRNPFNSLDKYTKYMVTVYVEKDVDQQNMDEHDLSTFVKRLSNMFEHV